MTFLGVSVDRHDLVLGLLISPLVVIGFWAFCALLFAVAE